MGKGAPGGSEIGKGDNIWNLSKQNIQFKKIIQWGVNPLCLKLKLLRKEVDDLDLIYKVRRPFWSSDKQNQYFKNS